MQFSKGLVPFPKCVLEIGGGFVGDGRGCYMHWGLGMGSRNAKYSRACGAVLRKWSHLPCDFLMSHETFIQVKNNNNCF